MRVRGAVAAAVLLLAGAPALAQSASLSGRVSVTLRGLQLADAGPAVVYLEPLDAPAPAPLGGAAAVRQHAARFEPDFLVVAVGQPVEMPNDDSIFHNVFSYSRPNDFDLGLYRGGDSRTLRFSHAGPVRIYCSIHERMNGLVFVAPSRLYAVPSANGAYRIADVAPGRYRLRVWSQRLPELATEVTLAPGQAAQRDLALGAAKP
jgi:plastocyanin